MTERPTYIAFEGAEACGKSTQAALLAESIDALLTRETGGTEIGARIRAILHDVTVGHLDARAEAMLTAADRAQHIAQVVRPALDGGRQVVSDRSVYSSLAYQGYGRRLDLDEIRRLNRWATGDLWPDVVVFLDVPEEVSAQRLSGRALDRFEAAGDDFHDRVLAGFRTMAAEDPAHWITIDAIGSIDAVAMAIREALAERDVR